MDSALASSDVAACVIVDDASTDGTASVAASLATRDARVRVLTGLRRQGPAAARNRGLDAVATPLVCFLDADDELVDGGVRALCEALAATPGAVCAVGRFTAIGVGGESADVGRWGSEQLVGVVRRRGRVIESPEGLSAEALATRLVSPPPGAWVVDAATLRALGGFDPRARRSEDLELLVRLAWSGPVVAVDRDVLRYARHDRQRSAAHPQRRWGRAYTTWLMLRAAPGWRATLQLSRGLAAYHLELAERRHAAQDRSVRALGRRNLAAAGVLRVVGLLAAVMPRRALSPRAIRTVD